MSSDDKPKEEKKTETPPATVSEKALDGDKQIENLAELTDSTTSIPEPHTKRNVDESVVMPKRMPEGYWKEYLGSIQDDYSKEITKLAADDRYQVTLEDGSRKWYKTKKASVRQFQDLERARAEYNAISSKTTDFEAAEKLTELYYKCWVAYMIDEKTGKAPSRDEFVLIAWDESKAIADARNFKTLFGVPNFRNSLSG